MRTRSMLAVLDSVSIGPAASAESSAGGMDHLRLAALDLLAAESCSVDTTGFSVSRRDTEPPGSFLTNGHIIVTLWRAADPLGRGRGSANA